MTNLINNWILNELALCQKDYFIHIKKKELNLATTRLTNFAWKKLSNEYLELIKTSPWNTDTKNTVLFVYQQLLIMLHPAIPFITEHIYQEITQQKILESESEIIDIKDKNNELWQIDCCLLIISNIRKFRQKNKINEFYLELLPKWRKKLNLYFDFNHFCERLIRSKISILEKEKSPQNNLGLLFNSFIDLPPFGALWYQEKVDKEELQKKMNFYEKECEIISKNWLKNNNFLANAPSQLIEEKRRKLKYYQEQKKKLSELLSKN
jgi:valyl-tRNA synthetase